MTDLLGRAADIMRTGEPSHWVPLPAGPDVSRLVARNRARLEVALSRSADDEAIRAVVRQGLLDAYAAGRDSLGGSKPMTDAEQAGLLSLADAQLETLERVLAGPLLQAVRSSPAGPNMEVARTFRTFAQTLAVHQVDIALTRVHESALRRAVEQRQVPLEGSERRVDERRAQQRVVAEQRIEALRKAARSRRRLLESRVSRTLDKATEDMRGKVWRGEASPDQMGEALAAAAIAAAAAAYTASAREGAREFANALGVTEDDVLSQTDGSDAEQSVARHAGADRGSWVRRLGLGWLAWRMLRWARKRLVDDVMGRQDRTAAAVALGRGDVVKASPVPDRAVLAYWTLGVAEHCLTGETMVPTPNGMKRVDDPTLGTVVDVGNGMGVTHGPKSRGVQGVVRLETTLGYSFRATPDHKVLTWDGASRTVLMRECGSLAPGDRVVMRRGAAVGGESVPEREALLMGLIDGDGHANGQEVGLLIEASERGLIEAAQNGAPWGAFRVHDVLGCPSVVRLRAGSRAACEWAREWGLKSNGVSGRIKGLEPHAMAAYLRGMFEADGTVSRRGEVSLSQSNEERIRDVQALLLSLGVLSRLTLRRGSTDYKENRTLWTLKVLGGDNRRVFDATVGFAGERKRGLLLAHPPMERGTIHDTYPVGIDGYMTFPEVRARLPDALARRDRYGNGPVYERMADWVGNGWHFGVVGSIQADGYAEVWDVIESPTGRWLGNGFVVSNCPDCIRLSAMSPYRWAQLLASGILPGSGMTRCGGHCVPSGTVVAGAITGGYRMRYAGEVVELETAGGRRLTVTPNHPVATARGFVAAGLLKPSDQLLCHEGQGDIPGDPLTLEAVDEQHGPSVVDEVFGALSALGTTFSSKAPSRPEHFHGDGLGGESEVDVVSPKRHLWNHLHSARPKESFEVGLMGTPEFEGALAPESLLVEMGFGVSASADGSVGSGGLASDQFRVGPHGPPLDVLRFGPSANLDVSLSEPAGDSAASDAAFVRDALDRGSGEVLLDEVAHVGRRWYEGHVFDLQTVGGWYCAGVGNIIISNCRCYIELEVPA